MMNKFRSVSALRAAAHDWAESNEGHGSVADVLAECIDRTEDLAIEPRTDGWVYLLKSGDHFKIGRGQDLEKRVKQVAVTLPEALTLVHAISTDDPPGIESYWHRRFAHKRAAGEWFRLDSADVKAFKRRKFQ